MGAKSAGVGRRLWVDFWDEQMGNSKTGNVCTCIYIYMYMYVCMFNLPSEEKII